MGSGHESRRLLKLFKRRHTRGPGSRVNFEKDVTTTAENIWVDRVTGSRLKGDENEQIWRFEVDDNSGTPILTGELEDGSNFAIAEVN
jgi:hypothetical protein